MINVTPDLIRDHARDAIAAHGRTMEQAKEAMRAAAVQLTKEVEALGLKRGQLLLWNTNVWRYDQIVAMGDAAGTSRVSFAAEIETNADLLALTAGPVLGLRSSTGESTHRVPLMDLLGQPLILIQQTPGPAPAPEAAS